MHKTTMSQIDFHLRASCTVLVLGCFIVLAMFVLQSCGTKESELIPSVQFVEIQEPPIPRIAFESSALPSGHKKRIVCLVPSCTEVLYALGLGESVIGVDRWADFPLAATKLPRLGDYLKVQIEKIIDLQPDLVVCFEGQGDAVKLLRKAGLEVFNDIEPSTASVYTNMEKLARVVGVEKRGLELTACLKAEMETLRRACQESPRPRLLLVFDRTPQISVPSRSSFFQLLLDTINVENVSADVSTLRDFSYVGLEEVVDWNPDLIIDLSLSNSQDDGRDQAKRFWQKALPHDTKVQLTYAPVLSRPGPRILAATRLLAKMIRNE